MKVFIILTLCINFLLAEGKISENYIFTDWFKKVLECEQQATKQKIDNNNANPEICIDAVKLIKNKKEISKQNMCYAWGVLTAEHWHKTLN